MHQPTSAPRPAGDGLSTGKVALHTKRGGCRPFLTFARPRVATRQAAARQAAARQAAARQAATRQAAARQAAARQAATRQAATRQAATRQAATRQARTAERRTGDVRRDPIAGEKCGCLVASMASGNHGIPFCSLDRAGRRARARQAGKADHRTRHHRHGPLLWKGGQRRRIPALQHDTRPAVAA